MGRTAGYSRNNYNYRMDSYIEGNTVRRAQYGQTVEKPARRVQRRPAVSSKTRRNRERALQIDFGYVLFLTAAAIASLFVCVKFLQLQSISTAYQKSVTSLESQLSTLKHTNDAQYENIISSMNLEEIKKIAMDDLGMVYAEKGEVITYNSQDSDYVRQYDDVPTE